jgi:hypothetical protein
MECSELMNTFVHEMLHNHDREIITSFWCSQADCSRLEAFVGAAQADGLTFNSDNQGYISENLPESSAYKIWNNTKNPDFEWYAFLGSQYVMNPSAVQSRFPNVYTFFQDSVYEGYSYEVVQREDEYNVVIQDN